MKLWKLLTVSFALCLLLAGTAFSFTAVCGSGDTHVFQLVGNDIVGTATASGCSGAAQLLGYVDFAAGKWYWYRDWPSNSGCVEGVWYTGDISSMTYEWRNTAGSYGTGSCNLQYLRQGLEPDVENQP